MENSHQLQTALELSMLKFNCTNVISEVSEAPNAYGLFGGDGPTRIPRSKNIAEVVVVSSKEVVAEIVGRKGRRIKALRAKTNTYIKSPDFNEDPIFVITGRPEDVAEAKRQLVADADYLTQLRTGLPRPEIVTQRVTVPSSEHVAQIVGKHGWKIKGLKERADIKIPARGDNPTFVITGRPEDVDAVKRQLVIAAENVTKVSPPTKSNAMQNQSVRSPSSSGEELIKVCVRAPRSAVGFVLGPRGARIKSLQMHTSTFIVSPREDSKEQFFEVMGKPDDVERAKREIETYISMYIGGPVTEPDSDSENNSPRLRQRTLPDATQSKFMQQFSPHSSVSTPSPYVANAEEGVNNGAPLENPPAAATPTGTWGEVQEADVTTRSALSRAVFGRSTRSNVFNPTESPVYDSRSTLFASVSKPSNVAPQDTLAFHTKVYPLAPFQTSNERKTVISPKSFARNDQLHSHVVLRVKDQVAAPAPCGHLLGCVTFAGGAASCRCAT